MKYLVESNLGGYYVTENDDEIIPKTCGQCGETDDIILSYEGSLFDALNDYFNKISVSRDRILYLCNEYTDEKVIGYIEYEYKLKTEILNFFQQKNYFTEGEYEKLCKTIKKSQKANIEFFKSMKRNNYDEIIEEYKTKKYNKYHK